MTYLISIVHILTACLIVLLILMQDSKGGGFNLGGGGGSNTLFGTSGASHFLVKTTRWLALIFAITSLSLASLTKKDSKSVLDEYEAKDQKEAPFSQKLPPLEKSPDSKKNKNEKKKDQGRNDTLFPSQKMSSLVYLKIGAHFLNSKKDETLKMENKS